MSKIRQEGFSTKSPLLKNTFLCYVLYALCTDVQYHSFCAQIASRVRIGILFLIKIHDTVFLNLSKVIISYIDSLYLLILLDLVVLLYSQGLHSHFTVEKIVNNP